MNLASGHVDEEALSLALSSDGHVMSVGVSGEKRYYGEDGPHEHGTVRVYQYNTTSNAWESRFESDLFEGESGGDEFGISVERRHSSNWSTQK